MEVKSFLVFGRYEGRRVAILQLRCTVIEGEQTKQMRYRPTIESDFSILVVIRPEGRIETFKYRGSELICEVCGPDFRTAMIHTSAGGIAIDEPWTAKKCFRAR